MVADAHAFGSELFNNTGSGQTFLGPSTTSLINMIAKASGEIWEPGDEVIIAETNHEANAGAWQKLEHLGLVIKTWKFNRETLVCDLVDLEKLLSSRTKLVAMPHVSNLVGKLEDVRGAGELARSVGAQLFVDGVAYAPHRAMDVEALGVDWYVCSVYKVYGTHMAVLYGRSSALEPLEGPNHRFIARNAYPDKWEPGGISHEACAGFLALKQYLALFDGGEYRGRQTIETAFQHMEGLERPVESRLRSWLSERSDLTLYGTTTASTDSVPTVSFTHHRLASDAITSATDQAGIGIRHGNMYAVRLVDGIGVSRYPGVVRVSAVHYNTMEEIEWLIEVLDGCF
jgi:selenocysteine lyase/cysteine desulfurase